MLNNFDVLTPDGVFYIKVNLGDIIKRAIGIYVVLTIVLLVGKRRERDHWGDLGVDGWIILGRICRRWDVGMWTGLGWPRIETGGGRL